MLEWFLEKLLFVALRASGKYVAFGEHHLTHVRFCCDDPWQIS